MTPSSLDTLQLLALAAALGWASGLRAFLVMFAVGAAGLAGWVQLPSGLQGLASPVAVGITGFLAFLEFVGDKIPLVDSASDTVQTFIRIPAGAALAAAFFGDSGGAAQTLAALFGGGIAAGSHIAKAGARAFINTSPEPVSNVAASFGEDALLGGGLWLAIVHPLIFLAALGAFLLAAVWLARRLWRWLRSPPAPRRV